MYAYEMNHNGPNTEHRGTPHGIVVQEETLLVSTCFDTVASSAGKLMWVVQTGLAIIMFILAACEL